MPDKHTYTSNFISEVKFNHLGKGSASLKALTRTLNFKLFFTPKVLINRHKSDMGSTSRIYGREQQEVKRGCDITNSFSRLTCL